MALSNKRHFLSLSDLNLFMKVLIPSSGSLAKPYFYVFILNTVGWDTCTYTYACPLPPLLTLARFASLAVCHVVEDILHGTAMREVALSHLTIGLFSPLTLVGV